MRLALSSALSLLVALSACTASSTKTPAPDTEDSGADKPKSQCPAVTDGCMNEANHAECLAREAECPGEVLFLESCPLQFACAD